MGHTITGNSNFSNVPSVISSHIQNANLPQNQQNQQTQQITFPSSQTSETQIGSDNYSFDGFLQSTNGGLSNSNNSNHLKNQRRATSQSFNTQDRLMIMIYKYPSILQ